MAPAAHARSSHGARRPALGEQTSGYEKVWWILLMFVIAGLAVLLLVAPAPAMDAIKRPGRFIRRQARLGPWGAGPEGDLMRLVFVEGRSADERIGDFRGFAYATWPVGGGEEDEGAPLLLVYDRRQPKPFSVRLSEITRINATSVTTLASSPVRRPKGCAPDHQHAEADDEHADPAGKRDLLTKQKVAQQGDDAVRGGRGGLHVAVVSP